MACDKQVSTLTYRWLEPNQRLHANHGPIDLIIDIDAEPNEARLAFEQARVFVDGVLNELVAELPMLRTPVNELINPFAVFGVSNACVLRSAVAQHMCSSVAHFNNRFITPMAAVAGSVADATLDALKASRQLRRAFVNNGGDIAMYLEGASDYKIGVCNNVQTGEQVGRVQIDAMSSVRGVASSGWQGRSHSLGIADVVTVLASNAAIADAAATMIANEINLLNSNKIERVPAIELTPDSDLKDRLVTVGVASLSADEKRTALQRGQRYAQRLCDQAVIDSAYLSLQAMHSVVGKSALIPLRQSA